MPGTCGVAEGEGELWVFAVQQSTHYDIISRRSIFSPCTVHHCMPLWYGPSTCYTVYIEIFAVDSYFVS